MQSRKLSKVQAVAGIGGADRPQLVLGRVDTSSKERLFSFAILYQFAMSCPRPDLREHEAQSPR